jgi:hypothetical protein
VSELEVASLDRLHRKVDAWGFALAGIIAALGGMLLTWWPGSIALFVASGICHLFGYIVGRPPR